MKRVVVTGMGAITPIGNSIDAFWESVKAGKIGFDRITYFDTTDYKCKLAAQVKDFDAAEYMDKKAARRMEQFCQFAVAAAGEAIQDAGLDMEKEDAERCGVIFSSGIGGMEAARVLKLRGHEPVIHEKTGELGGNFIAASAESYKGKLRDLLTWYKKQMKDLDIEIHFNEEIRSLEPFAGSPVIVATGSVARVLKKVPGHEKMVEACEFLTGTPVGEKVAVVGGGLTGCEIAYELALQGKKPVIVEMKDDLIAQTGVCLANSSYLREWFAWKKVPVYLETTLQSVEEGKIICKDKEGSEITIPCDSVISSAGYLPNPLAEESRNVHLVGDCKQVGNLRSVVWRAYEVAMKI